MASVVLQLKALGINDVLKFDYMDAPPIDSSMETPNFDVLFHIMGLTCCIVIVKRSIELLKVLGALDSDEKLTTPLGTNMAALPVDPMLSKTLIASQQFGCSEEILIIVAMLSGESLFFTPKGEKKKHAEMAHKRFHSPEGTHYIGE